ncbi:MAG TPA: c-type cytochrome [Bryobacteraceae bacterium]|nr:c-type cytochrome [Bryobacteraceae bacterium]
MKRAPIVVIAIALALALGAAAWTFRLTAANGFSARQAPTPLESALARAARHWAVPENARAAANPVPSTPQTLAEARAHWADHCAGCHANDGSGDTEVGRNLYPRAPDMRAAATQQLSDGELFFIIQNGIRLTGMPAWGSGAAHDAQDSWKLVRFIRHLPEVSPAEAQEMSKMNPKTPAELEEERAEEEFLNGAHRPESVVRQENGGNPHAPEHHHH